MLVLPTSMYIHLFLRLVVYMLVILMGRILICIISTGNTRV